MRWSWKLALITLLVLGIEILIALFVRDNFIRPFLGDVLVVVLLYFGLRTILSTKSPWLVISVVIFAFTIELLQFLKLAELLKHEKHSAAHIILGSTFDPLDLLAYLLGGILAYFLGRRVDV